MEFVTALTHYFYPQYSNSHKAKLLHSSTLFVIIFLLVFYQFSLQFMPSAGVNILGYASSISTDDIVKLTNQKRHENGLSTLSYNQQLTEAAKAKGVYMLEHQFWAHVAPDGTEPWKFFLDAGYKYKYAGENLARDFSSAGSAIDAWMTSPSHKENMLSARYTDIGVAVVEGDLNGVDTTIIVQLFGKPLAGTATPELPLAEARTEVQITPTAFVQPTIAPTQVPPQVIAQVSPLPSPSEVVNSAQTVPVAGQSARLMFSPFTTTRVVSITTVVLLIGVMLIDGFVTSRRKYARIGGRTFAHLAFLGMILAIALVAKAGEIL
jgi:uncharacterized protein YkwD